MMAAALTATISAQATEQQIANQTPKSPAPPPASEETRVMTVECGNGGSVTFAVAPARSAPIETDSVTHVEKWKSITIECGNGGSLTFLIPAGK